MEPVPGAHTWIKNTVGAILEVAAKIDELVGETQEIHRAVERLCYCVGSVADEIGSLRAEIKEQRNGDV